MLPDNRIGTYPILTAEPHSVNGKMFFAKPKRCASASQYTLSVGIGKSIRNVFCLFKVDIGKGESVSRSPFPYGAILGVYAVQAPFRYSPEGTPPKVRLTGQFRGFPVFPCLREDRPDTSRTIPGHFPGIFRGFAPLYFAKFAKREPLPGGRFFLSGRVSPPYPPSIS